MVGSKLINWLSGDCNSLTFWWWWYLTAVQSRQWFWNV